MSTDGVEQIIEMHVTEIELMQCALTGQRWHEERPIVTGTTARPQLILTTNKWSSLRRFTMVSRCPRGQLITLELTSIAVDDVRAEMRLIPFPKLNTSKSIISTNKVWTCRSVVIMKILRSCESNWNRLIECAWPHVARTTRF